MPSIPFPHEPALYDLFTEHNIPAQTAHDLHTLIRTIAEDSYAQGHEDGLAFRAKQYAQNGTLT